ncbi:NAD-dependent epimerase/dehydratase family protein [Pseudomonas gingeri]|uniref:NAD-dependent epimerase/dehydratase family protein n=1 Tax=Pseudomonas gingeri TaxID=117681 RepID=A0A7Y7YE52_9PSED|nr:NAD-dependent epimerase/dehydratase family protein [Pseudomonas gingeri]NVZ25742.1 NAD-dependent epimerase/dehydratase family protein [Pseudomonas gingeri]NWB25364.1 NAD-dependent epimerase/dehydratase family protein [Pseudomonas gingeri]NWC33405.1 NAD-dependent epimerase/dehydratase family protein [Pseudomonas gingeri]
MKVLVTGANGFLGLQVVQACQQRALEVIACVRSIEALPSPWVKSPDLGPGADWTLLLEGVDTVIHTAGIAHRVGQQGAELRRLFETANVEGTVELARQALDAGVRRFIFISSIGVNGTATLPGSSFSESSIPAPGADYAISKWRAEVQLTSLLDNRSMELVIIRPPLIYSGRAPGNFQRLLKLVASGVPLPFASIENRRSMVALENVADFIAHCVQHPRAANEVFLISDGVDVSTPSIINYLADGMGRKPRLLFVPDKLLHWGARLLGKEAIYSQLCGSLVVDSSKAQMFLDWRPLITPEYGLIRAGLEFQVADSRN